MGIVLYRVTRLKGLAPRSSKNAEHRITTSVSPMLLIGDPTKAELPAVDIVKKYT